MNAELERLAASLKLEGQESRGIALAFGLSCAKRVEHLLEEQQVIDCLEILEHFVEGRVGASALQEAAERATALANQHRGSKSIDGCGHAAVSASYGVSKALAGKALEAAQYCAYACVYASGGYAAVADREAFEAEFQWQVAKLETIAGRALSLTATSDA